MRFFTSTRTIGFNDIFIEWKEKPDERAMQLIKDHGDEASVPEGVKEGIGRLKTDKMNFIGRFKNYLPHDLAGY